MARIGVGVDGQHWSVDENGTWVKISPEEFESLRKEIDARRAGLTAPREVQAAERLASETGPIDAALVSAGRGALDLREGIEDVWYGATGQQADREDLAERQLARETPYQALERAYPFLSPIARSSTYMLGGGLAGVGRGLMSALMRQGAVGGGIGALEYAPSTEERMRRSAEEAAMGVIGEGLARGIGRVFAPGMERRGGDIPRIIEEGEAIGMQTNPFAEVSRDSLRQSFEGGLESIPLSAGVMNARREANERVLAREAAKAIGEESEELTGEVLDRASERIGAMFEDAVGSGRRFNLVGAPLAQLKRIHKESVKGFTGFGDPLGDFIDTLDDMGPVKIMSGPRLHTHMRMIREKGRTLSRDPALSSIGQAYMRAYGALLDTAMRQLPREQAEALTTARAQWRDLSNIKRAADTEEGTLRVGALSNVLRKADESGYGLGRRRDPFYTAARYLSKVQPALPSSGTTERSWFANHLRDLQAMASGGGGVGGIMSGDPGTAIGLAAAPYALPPAIARAYLSRPAKTWLLRQPGAGISGLLPGPQGGPRAFPWTSDPILDVQGLLGMGGIGAIHGFQGLHSD